MPDDYNVRQRTIGAFSRFVVRLVQPDRPGPWRYLVERETPDPLVETPLSLRESGVATAMRDLESAGLIRQWTPDPDADPIFLPTPL